jgi:hypothetical protein
MSDQKRFYSGATHAVGAVSRLLFLNAGRIEAFLLIILLASFLVGCGTFSRRPSIKTEKVTVEAPADPEKPAQVDERKAVTTMPVPAESRVEIRPTGEIVVTPPRATEIVQVAENTTATTGTASVAIATKKAETDAKAKENGMKIAGGFGLILIGTVLGFLLPGPLRWPIPGASLAALGALFVFHPDPPAWMVAIPICFAAAGVLYFYVLKHKRAE